MKYDFMSLVDRQRTNEIAVTFLPTENVEIKKGFSKIPMWIADMNFPVFEGVKQRIMERLKCSTFGYFAPTEEYFESIIIWQNNRNHVENLKTEHIGYENGVLGGLASAIIAFTAPGESILVHTPAYIGFTGTIRTNGRIMIESRMKKDEQGIWRIDYEDMEKKIKENNIHFCIFCSPHNPTGRVWEREELETVMKIYQRNECIVFSDEIWSDLTRPGYQHIPLQSVSEDARNRTIALYAPSKTFSLAGLIGSYHIVYNKFLRDKLNKSSEATHYNSINVLSMESLIGAYQNGEEWVDELRKVLSDNIEYACDFIQKKFQDVEVTKPQGTYMLYLDCSKWCEKHQKPVQELVKKGMEVGVIWQDGEAFKHPNTIRVNLALPKALVEEAMHRLEKYVFEVK